MMGAVTPCCICWIFIHILTKYCMHDQIEKNEMDGACSKYGGQERCIQGFGLET